MVTLPAVAAAFSIMSSRISDLLRVLFGADLSGKDVTKERLWLLLGNYGGIRDPVGVRRSAKALCSCRCIPITSQQSLL